MKETHITIYIHDLEISDKSKSFLARVGLMKLDDLLNCNMTELSAMRNISEDVLQELNGVIAHSDVIIISLPDSVHCHMFRRTRATNLYQDGIAIELVSTVLGHARTDTTKSYYAKPSVEQLRDAMESVPTPVSDEAPMWEGNEDEMARLCGLR